MNCIQCGKRATKTVLPGKCPRIKNPTTIYFCATHWKNIHLKCSDSEYILADGRRMPPHGPCVGFVLKARKRSQKSTEKVQKYEKGKAQFKKKGREKRIAQIANLTHVVLQGFCGIMKLNQKIRFGTAGCGPCVGIIVVFIDKRILCAHIDHHLKVETAEKPDNLKNRKSLRESLKLFLPPTQIVLKVGVASNRDSKISQFTIDRIKEIYKAKLSKSDDIVGDNIYITENKQIKSGHFDAVRYDGAIEVHSNELHIIETRQEGLIATADDRETFLEYAIA